MDLRQFFQKIKAIEDKLEDTYAVVVSHETADGGKPGVLTEVHKSHAAQLVVEGKARLATKQETDGHRQACAEAKQAADKALLASRVQLSLVSDQELKALKNVLQSAKKD